MSRPIIEVKNLSKVYQLGNIGATRLKDEVGRLWDRLRGRHEVVKKGEFQALRDVSFSVQPGEVLGIIGRNGAGKSTLLKILSRITQQTAGEIILRGRVASLLEVGTGFHPDLTGRENTFLNGAILGMTRAEIARKLDEIIAFAEIEQFIDTPVKRYSSGMYVRLAFSVAAHLEPEILVLDEVLAVGDAAFQRKCFGKIGEASRSGRTILLVSHSMESVRKLCDRAVLLQRGTCVADGKPDAVIENYLHEQHAGQSSYDIRLPEDETPGYARRLTIEDLDGTPRPAVAVGEPWRVRVLFTLRKRMENFVIALGINTFPDIPLRTVWSTPSALDPGDYEAVFTEDKLFFSAGSYSLVIGLSNGGEVIQYIERVGFIEIEPVSRALERPALSGAGFILNSMEISIRPAAKGPL